jgi:hypothetical protein
MLSPTRVQDSDARAAWALRLPSKLKIFSYLASIDRLSSRANLHYKGCAPTDTCATCAAVETCRHLLFDCSLAASVWDRIGMPIPSGPFSFWDLQRPAGISGRIWRAGVVVILWCIWKARNDIVFRNGSPSTVSTLRLIGEELTIWRWRFKPDDRPALDALRSFVLSMVPPPPRTDSM